MAFRRKLEPLLSLGPDVAVISECAQPDIVREKLKGKAHLLPPATDIVWIGSNKHKGLAILAFNGYKVQLADCYDSKLRFIAPVEVWRPNSDGDADFHLLGAWAMHANDGIRKKAQAGPLRESLDIHAEFLTAKPSIAAGDFNNNVFWDRPGWAINFEDTVARFDQLGMISAYHAVMNEAQGDESIPTHYWRDRKKDGPTYHIDFIFIPKDWERSINHFEVGTFEDWCGSKLSDHVPLTIDLPV